MQPRDITPGSDLDSCGRNPSKTHQITKPAEKLTEQQFSHTQSQGKHSECTETFGYCFKRALNKRKSLFLMCANLKRLIQRSLKGRTQAACKYKKLQKNNSAKHRETNCKL